MELAARPPLSFIVEGHGEYESYPSIVASVLGITGLHVPILNARGVGGIISDLEQHLDDLVTLHHPFGVVVTLDLRDVLDQGLYDTCAATREDLMDRISEWAADRAGRSRFDPMPDHVGVVLQIQCLETWWMADPHALLGCGAFEFDVADCQWGCVDDDVSNPVAWLKQRAGQSANLKSPRLARAILGSADVAVMRAASNSFDKFARDVTSIYQAWMAKLVA